MDYIFDKCVQLLYWLAPMFDMTYKEINIWIFVILEPLIFFIMLFYILHLRSKLRKIKL